MPGVSGQGVFLSYRREDAGPYARSLQLQLGQRIPGARVFMDLDSIEAGLDFVEVIEDAVNSCAVLVALIGRQWATLTDEDGARRLDNPDDFVRFEVKTALGRGVRVIPVLIDGARPLRQQELPDDLRKLARLNAHKLSYDRYQDDADRLLDLIQRVLTEAGDRAEAAKAREIADRQAREEADRQAREEADRQAREEADRQAREEADRQAREEADRQAREEADRQAREKADRQAREKADRQAREEADRHAPEKAKQQTRSKAERQALRQAKWQLKLAGTNRNESTFRLESPDLARSYDITIIMRWIGDTIKVDGQVEIGEESINGKALKLKGLSSSFGSPVYIEVTSKDYAMFRIKRVVIKINSQRVIYEAPTWLT